MSKALQLSRVGQLGSGAVEGLDGVRFHVQKGRGQYHGHGGFYTTLAKMIMRGVKALLPHAKSAAKAALEAGKVAAKEVAKKQVGELTDRASKAVHAKLEGAGCDCSHGHGMRLSGEGMRVSGSGRSLLIGVPTRASAGSGMRVGHGMRLSA